MLTEAVSVPMVTARLAEKHLFSFFTFFYYLMESPSQDSINYGYQWRHK
jgi:hypothetical protein